MFGRLVRTLGLAAGAIGVCVPSLAAPVSYTFTLTIDAVRYEIGSQAACQSWFDAAPPSRHLLGCNWRPMDQVVGSFTVDHDGFSGGDGIYSFVPMVAWEIQIGEVIWDMNEPSDFSGFRDGRACNGEGVGLGGINPGLEVSSGQVTRFCGGVYGSSDTPFIDFDYAAGLGRFSAFDGPTRLLGTYEVRMVDEPASIALAALALLLAWRASRPGSLQSY